jgi:hypothetical protein
VFQMKLRAAKCNFPHSTVNSYRETVFGVTKCSL